MLKLVLLILICMPIFAQAEIMLGKVIRIVDGDMVVFLDQSNQQHKDHLAGAGI